MSTLDKDKKFEELVNSDKDSSSLQPLIVIHQNSEFLEEE